MTRLAKEQCDVCTLTLPAEDVTVITSSCGRYEVAECDPCRNGEGLKEFYPTNPNR